MEAFLNRKYKFTRHDDQFDNYLASLGMNFITRKLAKSIPSSCELVKLGENEYSFNTILPFKTHQQKFILGKEIEHETIDGRKVKNIFTLSNGNTLTEEQTEEKSDRTVKIVRIFSDKELQGTATVKTKVTELVCKMWSDHIVE